MGIININNTLNQIQNGTNRLAYENGKKNLGSSNIGKDAFMQLLLTQLKYQDPTNPVSDKEFISQQAQFAQLEKLDDINASIGQGNNIVQASNLVGKKVDVTTEEGTKVSGVIDSIEMSDKGLGVRIGDQLYPPSRIIKIYANASS